MELLPPLLKKKMCIYTHTNTHIYSVTASARCSCS